MEKMSERRAGKQPAKIPEFDDHRSIPQEEEEAQEGEPQVKTSTDGMGGPSETNIRRLGVAGNISNKIMRDIGLQNQLGRDQGAE
jgi:hypothetical protein